MLKMIDGGILVIHVIQMNQSCLQMGLGGVTGSFRYNLGKLRERLVVEVAGKEVLRSTIHGILRLTKDIERHPIGTARNHERPNKSENKF